MRQNMAFIVPYDEMKKSPGTPELTYTLKLPLFVKIVSAVLIARVIFMDKDYVLG
jgi:hypothetical protein